jgi:hypothetical protein
MRWNVPGPGISRAMGQENDEHGQATKEIEPQIALTRDRWLNLAFSCSAGFIEHIIFFGFAGLARKSRPLQTPFIGTIRDLCGNQAEPILAAKRLHNRFLESVA